jgi:hypothetical protein
MFDSTVDLGEQARAIADVVVASQLLAIGLRW